MSLSNSIGLGVNKSPTTGSVVKINSVECVLEDSFSNGSLDLSKWVQTDVADGVSQAETMNGFEFTNAHTDAVQTGLNDNQLLSIATLAFSDMPTLQANLDWTNPGINNAVGAFEIYRSNTDRVGFASLNTTNDKVVIYAIRNNIVELNITTTVTKGADLKVRTTNGVNWEWYYWNGSIWVLITTSSHNLGPATFNARIFDVDLNTYTNADTVIVKDLYYCKTPTNYTTQYP